MTDLRQGVTRTQHAVLDLIDHAAGLAGRDSYERIAVAKRCVNNVNNVGIKLEDRRLHAMLAAAIMLNAAEVITSMIDSECAS